MSWGPGRYDDICSFARELTGAQGAILIIFGGRDGEGFSIQAPAIVLAQMPAILRNLADAIEKDMNEQSRASR